MAARGMAEPGFVAGGQLRHDSPKMRAARLQVSFVDAKFVGEFPKSGKNMIDKADLTIMFSSMAVNWSCFVCCFLGVSFRG
jgi:hypothetical protein